MAFHALLAIRDEGDIIRQSLEHLLQWADHIHVLDTGSTDDTWNIVRQMAGEHPQLHPLESTPLYFNDTKVRSYLFHVARAAMKPGDWVLRCDADEFYHVLPPEFVSRHMKRGETAAYRQFYEFQFTTADLSAWEDETETEADRIRPIEQRRTRFTIADYAEPRLFRYRNSMQWPPHASFPFNAGFLARNRMPIRHYPNRDPAQMRRRCLLRSLMIAEPRSRQTWIDAAHHHWDEPDWRKFVVDDSDPALLTWDLKSELPDPRHTNHLAPPMKRSAQWLAHRFVVPWSDRFRPAYPADARPDPIPGEVQEQIAQAMKSATGQD